MREIALKGTAQVRGQVGKTTEATTEVEPRTTEVGSTVRGLASKTTDVTTEVEFKTTEVSTQVKELLLELKGEMSVDEIRQRVCIADREDFRKRYLTPALTAGYIEMTQPNSPRSPTQRYRLTSRGAEVVGNRV